MGSLVLISNGAKQTNAMKNIPLGIRNNNPLNIRRGKSRWKGEKTPSNFCPPKGLVGVAFCRFESMEWGLRAAFCILRTYRDKHKANCIEDIITRWAPPSENDTDAYIKAVCKLTGFGGKERLTEKDWPRLVAAMARQECGITLSEDVIQKGFRLFKVIQN